MAGICKKCLLREMAEADMAMIEKYKAAIKEADRVSEVVYEERLSACKACDRLNEGTCGACGCYVELRALARTGKCPYKKWVHSSTISSNSELSRYSSKASDTRSYSSSSSM